MKNFFFRFVFATLAMLALVNISKAQDPDTVWTHNVEQYGVYSRCVRFMPDGKSIIAGAQTSLTSSTLYEFETATGKILRKFNQDTLNTNSVLLTISPDGKTIVTGGENGNVYLWDYKTGKLISQLMDKDSIKYVYSICFSPNGDKLFLASNTNILVVNTSTRKIVRQIHFTDSWSNNIAISPDGKYLALDNQYISKVDQLRYSKLLLYDANNYTCLKQLDEITRDVNSIAFSPNSKYVAFTTSQNEGQFLRLYNIEKQTKEIYPRGFFGYSPHNTIFLKDDNYLLLSGGIDTISKTKLLQIDSGKTLYTINYGGGNRIMDINITNQLIFDRMTFLALVNSRWLTTGVAPNDTLFHSGNLSLTNILNKIILNNRDDELVKFINVFDINGKLVKNYSDSTSNLSGTTIELPFSEPTGVYFCRIVTTGNDYSFKFIMEPK